MKKKKIAIIGFFRGGIGHYVAHLTPYLKKKYNIYYISYVYGLADDKMSLDDYLIAYYLKKAYFLIDYNNWQKILLSLNKVITFIKKNKIDVVNIHIATLSRATAYYKIALVSTLKRLGIPVVYTFHDVESFEKYEGGDEILGTLYSLADYATVGSQQEKNKLIAKFAYKNKNIVIAPHGIYNLFDFNKYDKDSARSVLKIPKSKKVILMFGYLRAYKGLDDLIRAFKYVIKKEPDAFLYINCAIRTWGEPKKILKLSDKEGIKKYCLFNFKQENSKRIEAVFKASDIICLPYKKVSQSGVLNLAFAFDKPAVISTLFAEANKVNNRMGLLIKPGNIKDIANNIITILKNDKLRLKFAKNIKNYKKEHSWEKTSDALIKVIEKSLNKQKR